MIRAGAAVALLALALSACGGLPDAELFALTAPTPPPICPIDDGACEEPPAPVIVDADGGADHESAVDAMAWAWVMARALVAL